MTPAGDQEQEDWSAEAIAIVGMACRFADIDAPDQLWQAVLDGCELIDRFGEPERPGHVPASGKLHDGDCFDAELFGMSPSTAELTDPQHRVFLECCWQAFEHAGHDPARFPGEIGVYAGSSASTYLQRVGADGADDWARDATAAYGNDKDFLATRVSFELGLTGPSMAVQTACSTSLTAVHLAVQSLADYECDLAIAGGSSVVLDRDRGYQHHPEGILSPDGHCRPFSADSGGTVPSDGVVVVVLRRLVDAIADGDHVIAVILGSATRNDGRRKLGFSAPSVAGQVAAMRAAYATAGIDPGTVGLVETHGTATELGDPIEFTALRQVLGEDRPTPCRISAVKGILGHTDAASGAAGLIVAAMALNQATFPPVHHFDRPNPRIELAGSGLCIPSAPQPWPAAGVPRRAAVNSLGIGGTNVHVVLQEPPPVAPPASVAGRHILLPLSAATPEALESRVDALSGHGAADPGIDLAALATTLRLGRAQLRHRAAVVATDVDDLRTRLETRQMVGPADAGRGVRLGFLFPGGGAQRLGMGCGLYREFEPFRAALRDVVAEAEADRVPELRAWLDNSLSAEYARPWIQRPESGLPALFLIEYALATMLTGLGLRPDRLLGHSMGEYTAAALAEIFDAATAFAIIRERGRLLSKVTAGRTLAVALDESKIGPLLAEYGVDLAAANGPGQTVLSGPAGALERLAARLSERDVDARLLPLAAAAHSSAIDPYLDEFGEFLSGLRMRAPSMSLVSCLTGTWARPEEISTPEYWVRHLRQPVRFGAGLRDLVDGNERTLLLEVGPGGTLGSLVRRNTDPGSITAVPVCSSSDAARPEADVLLSALGTAWTRGCEVRWERLDADRPARRIPCPGYPFERVRYVAGAARPAEDGVAENQVRVETVGWRSATEAELGAGRRRWLVLADHGVGELADQVTGLLRAAGDEITRCTPAELPDRLEPSATGEAADVLWIAPGRTGSPDGGLVARYFHALDGAAAIGGKLAGADQRVAGLTVLTSGAFDVSGSDPVDPAVAPYLSLVSALPAETGIKARLFDLGRQTGEETWSRHLLPVLRAAFGPATGALRGTRWWVPAPVDVTAPAAPARVERPVVLVTGGLGGVGSHLARYLVETRGARLALVSRRGADTRPTAELLGTADLMVIEADITEDGAAHTILERVVARFGRVDMVVHAAAVPFGAMLEVREGNRAREIHAVKMRAAVALAEAAEQVSGVSKDTVLVLISSKANAGGAVGSFDYLAANLFLDSYAQCRTARTGIRTASVAWDRWRGIGMARELERKHHERTGEWLADGMPAAAAARAFGRCLDLIAAGERYLVVSAAAHAVRHERTARDERTAWDGRTARDEPEPPESRPHPRAGRLGAQVLPRTELEETLIAIWEKVLRMDSIGVTDNFFDLGGDSLIGMQIVRDLRSSHGQGMSVGLLFRHPTVRALAAALAGESVGEPRVSRSVRRTVADYRKERT